ncbi:MAG: hypothetical protein HUU20_08645 [Pirellulales bacterium]|nr:hypothetical protein [Pirellulales bacterium]
MRTRRIPAAVACLFQGICLFTAVDEFAFAEEKALQAGAAIVDITPREFPAIVSGGFLERTADSVQDPLYARSLVLDDGKTRVAMVVVDSLMMPRDVVDDAKRQAEKATGIRADRMLVAATHTHSAPSVGGALGTGVDENYVKRLPGWIADAVQAAAADLAPAKVGWAAVCDPQHTNCRRWILRPDRIGADPFGLKTIRAMMHPGYQNPDYVGPAGPEDPYLTVLSVKSLEGQPIAVLANYSMHYFGAGAVSADYYGRFCTMLAELIGSDESKRPMVTMMSQGTSGDLHWMDYSRPKTSITINQYAQEVAQVAFEAYKTIQYRDSVPLAMAERKLTLRRRVPDAERLAWARKIAGQMQGRTAKDKAEVYALEQIYLHEDPVRELKLQAIRVGDLGITAMPCEVFGITGLKIKAQSPLKPTMNFELANGCEGYIPPPEQHKLGGYTTWPARTAGLEVGAEPQVAETVLELLEEVSGGKRREAVEPKGKYAQAVLAAKPAAYWRLGEFAGPQAKDSAGEHHGVYEHGVALYLDGIPEPDVSGIPARRAAHFAGGRMAASVAGLGNTYSAEAWFFNGMPSDARQVTGYLFSRGPDGAAGAPGDHLGIGGTAANPGKLIFYNGDQRTELLEGNTEIAMRTWNHVVLVREGNSIKVYLNGKPTPEIAGEAALGYPDATVQFFVGGRSDNLFNFEGKIDEAAVYDRALTPEEIAEHYAAAGIAGGEK